MFHAWRLAQAGQYKLFGSLVNRKYQSVSRPRLLSEAFNGDLLKTVAPTNIGQRCSSFHSRFNWFSEVDKQQQQYENSLLAKKERTLQKALKNKFEQELVTLEKVQKCNFDILNNWSADPVVLKVQSPRFNEIKEKVFQIQHDQIERTQEAIDVKRLLIIQNEKDDVSVLLKKFEEIRKLETKYQGDQIETIKTSIADLELMMLGVEQTYGKASEDKNHELMKSFAQKHQKLLEEQIQRHEEILQNYNELLQINME